MTDVFCPVSGDVFATDASMKKGAIVRAPMPLEVAQVLWLDSDKKGNYTKLDSGFRAALKAVEEFDDDHVDSFDVASTSRFASPEKPPQFRFDFAEVFGGGWRVSRYSSEMGFVVCPVLDISRAAAYNMSDLRFLEWLLHMLSSGLIAATMLEPPCTSFSPAAHPVVRSYDVPRGWNRRHPKVLHGNLMAFRSLIVMMFCHFFQPALFACHLPPGISPTSWFCIGHVLLDFHLLTLDLAW